MVDNAAWSVSLKMRVAPSLGIHRFRSLFAFLLLCLCFCAPVRAQNVNHFLSGDGNLIFLGAGMLRPLLDGDRNAFWRTTDTLLVNTLVTQGLKIVTRERRPDGTTLNSFPSGHASAAFVIAAQQSHYHPNEAVWWYTGATLIAYSRVALHRHYIHDVVAGAALGYLTATVELDQSRGLLLTPLIRPGKQPSGSLTLRARF